MTVSRLIKNSRIPYEYFHAIFDLEGRNLGPMTKKTAVKIANAAYCNLELFQSVPVVGKLEYKRSIKENPQPFQHAAFDPVSRIKTFRIRGGISSEALEYKVGRLIFFLSQGIRCTVFCDTDEAVNEVQRDIVSHAKISKHKLMLKCFPRNSKANWS